VGHFCETLDLLTGITFVKECLNNLTMGEVWPGEDICPSL
jgi:hypothetical protein